MITETLFIALLFFTLVLVGLTLYFKSVAIGAFSLVLLLLLALPLFPGGAGVSHISGKTINTTTVDNSTTTAAESYSYSTYTDIYVAMTLILFAFYLTLQIIWFGQDNKKKKEQEIDAE